MAGLFRQDLEFWNFVKEFDYVGLCETWVSEEGWNNIKNRLPETHNWVNEKAKKKNVKGRASGGIIVGKSKLWGEGEWESIENSYDGIIHIRGKEGKEYMNIIIVYNSIYGKDIGEILGEITKEYENENIIIGGDFNIRIGELGGEEEEWGNVRKSKDKIIGNGGERFIEKMQEMRLSILNGKILGDWEGEYTYVGVRGNTVIDFIFVNEKVIDKTIAFKVEDRVDSDHMPVSLEIETEEEEARRGQDVVDVEEEDGNKEENKIISWSEEDRALYKANTEEIGWSVEQEEATVDERWEKLKDIVKKSMTYKERRSRKKKLGHKDWWNRSCTRKKREVKRAYRKWRKGVITRKKFLEQKKELKEYLEERRKNKRKEEEVMLRSMQNETEIWKFINMKRKKREWHENNIEEEEWRSYFMNLLGGAEYNERGKISNKMQREDVTKEEEEDLEDEEIYRAAKKMKLKKAAGKDKIPMEAWMYGGKAIKEGLMEVIRRVWKEGEMPEDWKESIIVPLYKRGEVEKVGNYRGISLLCTAYKLYAEILRHRLEKEVEEHKLLPESQAGFRKKSSTIDNIYVLNHIVQREKEKEKGEEKIYALFIDLKAAFDKVNRSKLWEILEEKEVSNGLIWRLKKIYEDTKATIRTKKGLSRGFRIDKGVRQGCVLSPILFNLYIADLDSALEKRGIGGVALGTDRIWSLAYADDIILLAKNKEAMEDMMQTLKRFLKERDMILSAEKTKIMVFNKAGNKTKESWKWEKDKIEEVNEFKYLGFTFNRKGNYVNHIKEISKKGRIAAGRIWSLGERICKDDFKRRWTLFKYLVQSIMEYGVEIWGWRDSKEIEKVMLDYVRWVFRIDFCTPRYLIYRELGLEKGNIRWGIRAWKYEEKIKDKREENLVRKCWEEKEKAVKKELFSREREKYFNNLGWNSKAIEEMKNYKVDVISKIKERGKDIQLQIEDEKIREARYNKRYKEIDKGREKPKYLSLDSIDRETRGDEIRALVKIRCGNMEEDNKYWREESNLVCKFCNEGKDNIEHYVKECKEVKGWFQGIGRNEEETLKNIWNDNLDKNKGKCLVRLWKEKDRIIRKGKQKI